MRIVTQRSVGGPEVLEIGCAPLPEPLPAVELAKFQRSTSPMLAKLKTLEATQVAVARQ